MSVKKCIMLKSVCGAVTLAVIVTILVLWFSMGKGGLLALLTVLQNSEKCKTELADLFDLETAGAVSEDPINSTLGVHNSSTVLNNLSECSKEDIRDFFFYLIVLILMGLLLFIGFIMLIIEYTIDLYYSDLVAKIKRHKYVTNVKGSAEKSCPAKLVQATLNCDKRSSRKVKIKVVLSVNNTVMRQQYNDNRMSTTEQQIDLPDELQQKPVLTSVVDIKQESEQVEESEKSLLKPSTDSSEVCLFYTAKLEHIPSILKEGFPAKPGEYGKAIQLAETAAYSWKTASNCLRTHFAIIVARVNLGRVFILKEEDPVNLADEQGLSDYDTVIVQFDKHFREFLVRDQKNIDPEYVIVYERCY